MSERVKSLHLHGVDRFWVKAIKYIAAMRGTTMPQIVVDAINTEIDEYPDLCRGRDEYLAEADANQRRDQDEFNARMGR